MDIRNMKADDMGRIIEITNVAWNEFTLYKLLEDRHGIIGNKGWQQRKETDIRAFCKNNPSNVIVAIEEGKVVGYACFTINREDSVGQVSDNAVDPAFQGQGIGGAMNKWILGYFRKQGLRIAKVSTFEHDKPARHVYEKQGFKEIARSIHYSMEL